MAGQACDAHKLAAVFPSPDLCEMLTAVKLWLVLRRLLSILAIVGLVVAPLVTPATAGGMTAAGVAAMADMPCCPDEKPAMPDCAKTCPLMAICLAKCFRDLSAGVAVSAPLAIAERIVPSDEAQWDSLSQAPPPRPPRP
jgi:hypothetical protein